MAQWMGQFSGHTHATRVADAEALLRHGVEVFLASARDPAACRKVRKLAERAVRARIQSLKARIDAVTTASRPTEREERAGELARLQAEEADLRAGGADMLLLEFGVGEAGGDS